MAADSVTNRAAGQKASLGPQPRIAPPTVSSISTITTQEGLRELLDELRQSLGLSYTQIGTRAGKGMGRSTAQAMIKGGRLPRRKHLLLFLQACKVPTAERAVWLSTWTRLAEAELGTAPTAEATTSDETALFATGADAPEAHRIHSNVASDVASEVSEAYSTSPSTATTPPATPSPPGRKERLPTKTLIRALIALTTTTLAISGSAIAMWLTHVPTEVIISVYGLVTVCVAAWTAVSRVWVHTAFQRQENLREPSGLRPGQIHDVVRRTYPGEQIVGEPPKAAPPVIG